MRAHREGCHPAPPMFPVFCFSSPVMKPEMINQHKLRLIFCSETLWVYISSNVHISHLPYFLKSSFFVKHLLGTDYISGAVLGNGEPNKVPPFVVFLI